MIYSMTVSVSNTSAAALVTVPLLCNGDSTGEINGAGSNGLALLYNYQWDAAAGNANTATVLNIPAGTYTVMVTDSIGCADSATVTIAEPTAISPITDTVINILCNGDSTGSIMMTITGGTTAYSFLWSNGEITEDISGLGAGIYTITITDANGCTASGSETITESSAVVASAIDNSDGSATAYGVGGSGSYTFMWDAAAANQTTATATGLVNGTYNVTVTDANGCMDSVSVTITISGLGSITNVSNLNMFPNPTSGNVFVELDLVNSANVQIRVMNSIGQTVTSRTLNNVQSQKVTLETSTLPAGIYIVQFTIGNEQMTRKLIISK